MAAFGAGACDCIVATVKQAVKRADVVLVGKVVQVTKVEITHIGVLTPFPVFVQRVELQVEQIFKGRLQADRVVVYASMDGTDCGVEFETNKRYVVYADRDPDFAIQKVIGDQPLYGAGIFWTSSCARTRPFDEAEIKELEAMK